MSQPISSISFLDVLRFMYGYWRRWPARWFFSTALFIVSAFIETYMPSSLATFLEKIRQHADAPIIYAALGIFIGNYFIQLVLRVFSFFIYNQFETRIFKGFLDDAFAHVHSLSEQFFLNNFTGSIISKITRARTKIETLEDHIFHRIVPTFIVLISSAGFLALRFQMLAALFLVYLVLLLSISVWLVIRWGGPRQKSSADAHDSMMARLADCLSSIAAIRSYAQEREEFSRFQILTDILRQKTCSAYYMGGVMMAVQQVLMGGMLLLLLGGGTWSYLHGRANIEDIAYLVMAYSIMQAYLRELSFNFRDMMTASYDLHGVIELLRQAPQVTDAPQAKPLVKGKGAIEFDRVTFAYPDKALPIFKDFSLTIRAGERVALVGHSGSGKTTFLRVLQRSYDVQQGRVLIDGQDIAIHTQNSLHAAIALVPQDPILFHRSLRDNIAYGRPEATMDEIRLAAKRAHIDDFILGLPERYDTLVGERGIKLSGGERQRIAIARAILADRPILILDEATSSLDSVSEKAIQDALHTLIQGRTSLMVAHRLSTILDADRILVFDRGCIVEEGTHADLLSKGGVYAHLFTLQSGGLIGV